MAFRKIYIAEECKRIMEEYEELGLTKNESKVYQALIEHGKLGSGDISKNSRVSYSKIYNVLDSLINKGLVKVVPEKSKKFIPSSPESLIKLIEEKQKKLETAKEKARKMQEFYDTREQNPVSMVFGRIGFYKIVKELKEPDKYDYTIKWSSDFKPEFVGNAERRLKKGKDIKVLARYDSETEKNVKKWIKVNKNIRKFENEGVAMSIIDDEEVMIGLIKSNVTLLVKDSAFAKVMKKMFLDSFEGAKKV